MVNGFIKPYKSSTSARILFNQKLDGFFPLYVNYKSLNNLTIKNQYSLPLIGELLDKLEKARRFIKLDFTSAYYQMRICKRGRWKMIFKTRYSHFEYQVMSFELTNAPISFQKFINKIFTEKLDIFIIVYLNNIFIFINDDANGHIAVIQWVLGQLRKFLLYANLKKY